MSVRRILVQCAVLSLQDTCMFYPCCKCCFSRIDVQQHDLKICRCSKCGYNCLREEVDYRYRLSLRVSRDTCIFGVTVFGTCLNQFFGIHASGLQRFVEDLDYPPEAPTRSRLLVKAVEDCFIGRHFIFGIKVTDAESGPWFRRHVSSANEDMAQFIASQMLLPKPAVLGSCTVISYYKVLLQKVAEYLQGNADPNKTSRLIAEIPLLISHQRPDNSSSNSTFLALGLLSQSLQRSQHQDYTLNPTPPWQQSLGLVTSSAEQDESCSALDRDDKNEGQTNNKSVSCHAEKTCLEDNNDTELIHFSLESFSDSNSSLTSSLMDKADSNTPLLTTWFSPSLSHERKPFPVTPIAKRLTSGHHSKTSLSGVLAWDDLPFSESLTEFLQEEDKLCERVHQTEPNLNVQTQSEAATNDLQIIKSQNDKSMKSVSVHKSNRRSQDMLFDKTEAPAVSHERDLIQYLSDQSNKEPFGCLKNSQASHLCFCGQEESHESLSSGKSSSDHVEEDVYDCSADLFSTSLDSDMNRKAPDQEETVIQVHIHRRTQTVNAETSQLLSSPETDQGWCEKANTSSSATPEKGLNEKLQDVTNVNSDKLTSVDMIHYSYSQSFDFIPSSQSTPIVKVAAFTPRNETSTQKDSWTESAGANLVCSVTSSKYSQTFTPKRKFWKGNKYQCNLLACRKRAEPTGVHECDVTACDNDDTQLIVPPTTVKTQVRMKARMRKLAANQRCTLCFTQEGQQEKKNSHKRTLLDKCSVSPRALAQTETHVFCQMHGSETAECDNTTVNEGNLGESNGHISEACDCSRDLFSDSV
ncbi:DNA damage-induced apoptosis suppressor protein [Thalassophryne amazonica]|uniref:DNA damage-induced apoptosis suppressor protein n=1 Tax=Thalassophryne amazonica TaxID=390379 RepID=UPI00147264E9|nr:DNA damage-induced apoptosis suppressor protein [Thalassophryne amazonica]